METRAKGEESGSAAASKDLRGERSENVTRVKMLARAFLWLARTKGRQQKVKHLREITSVFHLRPPAIRLFLLSCLLFAVGSSSPVCPLTFAFTRFHHLIWLIVFSTPPFLSSTPGDTCWYGQHQPVGGVGGRSALQAAVHYKDGPEKCISICHLQSVTAIIEAALLKWDLLSFGCQQRFKAFIHQLAALLST